VAPNTLEAVGEATNDVEDKRTIGDRFAKISKGIRHVFEAVTVLRDGQIALAEVAEFGVEVEGASLLIAEELILEREPDVTSGGVPGDDGLGQLGGMVPEIQDLTTQSMRRESGKLGAGVSRRM
jgi:hypothetical protein